MSTPPGELGEELMRLRLALDREIPPKDERRNLLLASWNLRAMEGLTYKWRSEPGDSPPRDVYAIRCIAEMLSRFDVVALQGVRGDRSALDAVNRVLGSHRWDYFLTGPGPVELGASRTALLFDRRRINPSGMACELVSIPGDSMPWDAFVRQFAVTPFAASFHRAGLPFIVLSAPLRYRGVGDGSREDAERVAGWIAEWARDERAAGHGLFLVGELGERCAGEPVYDALATRGLAVPGQLCRAPRLLADDKERESDYRQIAWFRPEPDGPPARFALAGCGTFDFSERVMLDLGESELAARISDHLPLWVELRLESELSD
ncbi:MAG: hypothetical protein R6V85_00675 [Polyangia bacterium]